jgi:hypothetical protein
VRKAPSKSASARTRSTTIGGDARAIAQGAVEMKALFDCGRQPLIGLCAHVTAIVTLRLK